MKKTVLFGLAAVAALGFTACDNAQKDAQVNTGDDKVVLYSGVLPAADAQGTIYTLKLEFDDDNNYTDGDYTMVENTLVADTLSATGVKEAATSYTKGDFKKLSKQVDGATVEYIQLTPDAKDALGTPSASSLYFIVNPDQSLTMVQADLQKSETPGLNYTLTVK